MSNPSTYLVAQFTEDVYATEDRLCQRGDCENPRIRKGDRIYCVGTYDPTHPGQLVCGGCREHYRRMASITVRRATSGKLYMSFLCLYLTQIFILADNLYSMSPSDQECIRRSVAAAQSRGTVFSYLMLNLLLTNLQRLSIHPGLLLYLRRL